MTLIYRNIPVVAVILIFCGNLSAQSTSGGVKPELHEIFDEPYLPGVRPEFISFTAGRDGVLFSWNDSSHSGAGTYRVNLDGSNLQKWQEDRVENFKLSPDHFRVAYAEGNRLVLANTDFSRKRLLVEAQSEINSVAWSPDGTTVAYMKNSEVWIADADTSFIRQVTLHEPGKAPFELENWAGTGSLLLRSTDQSKADTVYFPDYTGMSVSPGSAIRGIHVTTLAVTDLKTGKTDTLVSDMSRSLTDVSHSGRYVAVDHADAALKRREIRIYDLETGSVNTVFRDSTSGWFSGRRIRFNPEMDLLMFQSERDNWNHIYTVSPDGSGMKQHTTGDYDIPWADWLDSESIIYASTEKNPGERHIYTLQTGNDEIRKLTDKPAYRYQFNLSPDKRNLVYAKTDFNRPYDLYRLALQDSDADVPDHEGPGMLDPCREHSGGRQKTDGKEPDRAGVVRKDTGRVKESWQSSESREREEPVRQSPGDREVQITATVPERFSHVQWLEEDYIRFKGRDGETEISMSVLYPHSFDSRKKYPVVVFFHGAGSLQNVYRGWSEYYDREYMFNQYLAWNGYVVAEVDFRHSSGYGRKFREDVTGWLGRYETQDVIDGLGWLKENVGGIDLDRVGSYGGSYGGFLSLYTTSVKPGYFHAAAAVRAVTNWRNYYRSNPLYTLPRLGSPRDDPENYDRSSPLTYVSELEHPVLILHGLKDDNVGFQDAAQYIEELINTRHGEFGMMMYPSEGHSFVSPESWFDVYKRIFDFFEEHVKNRDLNGER